eukprot:360723-Chlamydomonas_euryale.AAC.10
MACNPRNPRPAKVFGDKGHGLNLYDDTVEVDYRGAEVTVENFLRLLIGAEARRAGSKGAHGSPTHAKCMGMTACTASDAPSRTRHVPMSLLALLQAFPKRLFFLWLVGRLGLRAHSSGNACCGAAQWTRHASAPLTCHAMACIPTQAATTLRPHAPSACCLTLGATCLSSSTATAATTS